MRRMVSSLSLALLLGHVQSVPVTPTQLRIGVITLTMRSVSHHHSHGGCTGTVVSRVYGSGPYKTLGFANSLAPRVMNGALQDSGFLRQFEGTAPDNESGFHVSRQAQFSASGTEEDRDRPGITTNWTGRWEVQYTLGYAPETKLEAVIIPPKDYESWRRCMGIEPTEPASRQIPLDLKSRPTTRPDSPPRCQHSIRTMAAAGVNRY